MIFYDGNVLLPGWLDVLFNYQYSYYHRKVVIHTNHLNVRFEGFINT